MDNQRKECATGGDRQYMGLMHPIKFCDSYDKRRMACIAQDGSCGCQYDQSVQRVERESRHDPEQIWSPPEGEKIVATCLYRDDVMIATDRCVYRMRHDGVDYSVTPIRLEDARQGKPSED